MASTSSVCLVSALLLLVAATTMAKEFIVGDESGWTTGYDYQAWAQGKDFFVGDKLVFKYPVGAHNVFKVNGTQFQNCTKPAASEALTSGNDTIVLASPGRKWYICGVAQHCVSGQKLVITVQALSQPPSIAPSPQTYASSTNRPFLNLFGW